MASETVKFLRDWRNWLAPTLLASPLIALAVALESTCWAGPVTIRAFLGQIVWVAPLFAFIHGVWVSVSQQHGQSFGARRHVVTSGTLIVLFWIGARLWASTALPVQLQCAVAEAKRNPELSVVWLNLGGLHERMAEEETPESWHSGNLPPPQRLEALARWKTEHRIKAAEAYRAAEALAPHDWRPPERIAFLLFLEGQCNAGTVYSDRARTKASAIADRQERSEAEAYLQMLGTAREACE